MDAASCSTTLFSNCAKQRPLLLVVDDIERADEFSVSLLTALAHQTHDFPLIVITSETQTARDQTLELTAPLHRIAFAIQLTNLDPRETAELVESMFGQVPNHNRLTDWLYRVAHGNPKLTVELAEHLLERGIVRYVAGTWVLPSDDIVEAVPNDITQALALRLQTLSAAAITLAELLCVRRGGATPELCLSAGAMLDNELTAAEVFSALDELVRKAVLESAGYQDVFAQEALRTTLQRSLPPQRAAVLHECWARVLLAKERPSIDEQLEAGWHLVHTDDALRGADLLARIGPTLLDQGHAMAHVIPAVEKALAIYEQHDRPLSTRLRLRSALVLAGFFVDYRIAERYGDETLATLFEVSGFALATRLARKLPPALAIWLGLGLRVLYQLGLPKSRRGPPIGIALQYLLRTAMGLLGVRALALDGPGTQAIFELMAPLHAAPNWCSGPTVHAVCRALTLQQRGREGELDAALQHALKLLRRGRKFDMSQVEYQSLLTGALLSDGVNECYRENSQALRRADVLDTIGSRLAQAAAARIRMIYYLRRADSERTEQHRRQLDLYAIQGGTTWQVDFFSLPVEGMYGSQWMDLVMVRRALDRLDRLLHDVPSMRSMRDAVRIAYHLRRNEFERAADLGLQYTQTHPPKSIIGWGSTYANTGYALLEAGRIDEAMQLLTYALGFVSEADRPYTAMYGDLELAHATALALSGDRERSDRIFAKIIERLRAADEHIALSHCTNSKPAWRVC